jgi:hypothetical protein
MVTEEESLSSYPLALPDLAAATDDTTDSGRSMNTGPRRAMCTSKPAASGGPGSRPEDAQRPLLNQARLDVQRGVRLQFAWRPGKGSPSILD